MSDSYHTIGAIQDRAQTLAVLNRIVVALERIATALEKGEDDEHEQG